MKHVIIFSGPQGSGRALATRSLVVRGYNAIGFHEPVNLAEKHRQKDNAGLLLAELVQEVEQLQPNDIGGWVITGCGTKKEVEAFVKAPGMLPWNVLIVHLFRPGTPAQAPPVTMEDNLPLLVVHMINDSTDVEFTQRVQAAVAGYVKNLRDEAAEYFGA